MTNAVEALIQDALLARVGNNPRGLGVQARNELSALKTSIATLKAAIAEAHRRCGNEMADETQGPSETCCKMMDHVEELSRHVFPAK